jgi:hypothetical protein
MGFNVEIPKYPSPKEARSPRAFDKAVPEMKDEARPLWHEAKELHLIFAKIFRG